MNGLFQLLPRAFLLVVALSLLLRLGGLGWVATHEGMEAFVYGDAVGYISLAEGIAEGKGFVRNFEGEILPETFRTPGFPFLLSLFYTDGAIGLLPYAFLLSFLAGIFLPFFVWYIGRETVGERAGLIAAGLTAFEPHLIFFSWFPQTEMPFILAILAAVALILFSLRRFSYIGAILSGLFFGGALLIKPGGVPIVFVVLLSVFLYYFLRKLFSHRLIGVTVITMALVLLPWIMHVKEVTGVYAMSAAGWRNVYTDYVASIRAIENGTPFHVEKRKLKEEGILLGVAEKDIDNPAYGPVLRKAALKEIWAHKLTVFKLEAAVMLSFFTSDGYYYAFKRVGLIKDESAHVSATYTLLTKGIAGIPEVLAELKRQWFLPIFGRAFVVGTFLLAILGFFRTTHPSRFVFAAAAILLALSSSAIGFGVESRLRLPVEPFIFLLAGAAFVKKERHEI